MFFEKITRKLTQMVLMRPKYSLVACLLAAILVLPAVFNFKIDNSLSVLFEEGNEQDRANKAVKNLFGNIDELVVLSYQHFDLFSKEQISFVQSVHDDLINLSGIKSCYSLVNIPYFWNEEVDGEVVTNAANFLDQQNDTQKQRSVLRAKAIGNNLYVNNLINKDGTAIGFNLVFKKNISSQEKEKTIRDIQKLYEGYQTKGKFYLTGMHVFMEASGRFLIKDVSIYTVLLIIVMFIVLYGVWRSTAVSVAILLSAGIANVFTIACMGLLDVPLSMASTAVPSIVTTLCIAYTLHVFCANKDDIHEVLISNMLASLTSMIGFATLIMNPVPTVSHLGKALVFGTMFAALISIFWAVPLKFLFFRDKHPPKVLNKLSASILLFVRSRKKTIYVVSLLLFCMGFLFLRMKLDTNYYKYYRGETDLTRSVDFVNKHLSGQYPFVVRFSADSVKEPSVLWAIDEFRKFVKTQDGVDKVITYLDVLEEAYNAFEQHKKERWYTNLPLVEEMSMLVESTDRRLLKYYISDNNKNSAVFVRTNLIGSNAYKKLIQKVKVFLKSLDVKTEVSGTYINIVESADKMSASQLSFSFVAIGAILIIVFLFARRLDLTILAAIANMLPVFVIYGILGIFNEPLNMGTAIIAAIAFGIAVDDTIHFIVRYRYAREAGIKNSAAINSVFKNGVISIIMTSIVVSTGFLTLSLSSFRPVSQLGIYTAVAMILCLLIDIILLPRMLFDFNRREL